MASEKRIHNVNLVVAWGSASEQTAYINVPFYCSKVVIKPVIYNFTDAGAAPAPYRFYRITTNMIRDNIGDATIGVVLPSVYSTGGMPLLAGFTYMFDAPKTITGSFKFNSMQLNGTAATLAADSLICMEFYEA